MNFKKGQIVDGKYEIKHLIDSFNYCNIYSAKSIEDSNLLNLNVYNASKISRDDLDQAGNLKEINFLKLSISGLPELIEYGDFSYEFEKYKYFTTKFISGESVLDRIKRKGPLSEIEAVDIIEKIINITKILHSSSPPILLNGLFTDNIMFDLSSGTEEIVLRNLINLRFFDTPFKLSYMDGVPYSLIANESFNDVFTPKTDQFNIGALLFQLVEGISPWHNEKKIDINNSVDVDNYLDSRNTSLRFLSVQDIHLKKIIEKSLSKDPDNRFNTLDDMLTYLRREELISVESKTNVKISPTKKGNGFDDIGGMDYLKEMLKTEVIDVLNNPDHFKKYGVSVPNGMLLYGPPGCGKTFISQKFCEEAGFNFFLVKPSDLSSIYVSGGEEKIANLFNQAEEISPSVICFDEVDAIMPKRNDSVNQSVSSRVNEFLTQINKCSSRGIFVIATTNKPELIDDAILRTGRLEIQLYVGPPDFEARKSMFNILLKNRHTEVIIDYAKLAKLTENFISSDIDFIVNKAAHKAATSNTRISNEIIEKVLNNFKPSVTKSVIDSYKKSQDEYNSSEKENKRTQIGFKK
jgi:transitional endoplasmic reticulum ATPase